tara:strand:+ start:452 stop:1141 length:690 start_codon:yes stop_codon:yes gene_type:complete
MGKGILYVAVLSLCLGTIPVASGFSGEVDYSIDDSIFEIEFTGYETYVNDEASEWACFIDEEYGNNDGITLENETENYEVTVGQRMIGTEGNHYLNGIVAIIDQYAFEMSFSHGNCSEVDLMNISIEGKFSFDVKSSNEYVLLFNTTEDPRVNNLQVHYCIFEDFEVQSVLGLTNESIDEECVSGFRAAGEDMEIEFQDPQSSTIPSISYMSTIFVILLSSVIFAQRAD